MSDKALDPKKTRLFFDFSRTGVFTENGVCAIDVLDPEDDTEIEELIDAEEWSFLQILDREYANVTGDYTEWEDEEYN